MTTANTGSDGTGSPVAVFTGGANGSPVIGVKVKAVGATTAGMIRLFVDDTTDVRLIGEIPVEAVTPSATTPTWERTWAPAFPTIVPNGGELRATTHVSETFNVFSFHGDL